MTSDQPETDTRGLWPTPARSPGEPAVAEGAERVWMTALDDDLRRALGEAGIAVHDCDGPDRAGGGCCLTARPGRRDSPAGIIVSWTCADSLAAGGVDGDRYDAYRAVQDAMGETLWAIIDGFGYLAEPFGSYAVPLVVGGRPGPDVSERPWNIEDISDGGDDHLASAGRREPLYGPPLPAVEITPDGRLGRPCAACGRPYEELHYPQCHTSSGVCCQCWDGRALVASDEHPEGQWLALGRCTGHGPLNGATSTPS